MASMMPEAKTLKRGLKMKLVAVLFLGVLSTAASTFANENDGCLQSGAKIQSIKMIVDGIHPPRVKTLKMAVSADSDVGHGGTVTVYYTYEFERENSLTKKMVKYTIIGTHNYNQDDCTFRNGNAGSASLVY